MRPQRVRLLLEDGTVLAEGVRPVTEYDEAFDSLPDGYDISFSVPSAEQCDQNDDFERKYAELHALYYRGFNAVIKL